MHQVNISVRSMFRSSDEAPCATMSISHVSESIQNR